MPIPVQFCRTDARLLLQSCACSALNRIASAYSGEPLVASRISKIHSDLSKSSSSGRKGAAPSTALGRSFDLNHVPGARESLSSVWFSSTRASAEQNRFVNARRFVSAEIRSAPAKWIRAIKSVCAGDSIAAIINVQNKHNLLIKRLLFAKSAGEFQVSSFHS